MPEWKSGIQLYQECGCVFQSYIDQLGAVRRFDRVVRTTELEVGEVDAGDGKPQLAVRPPDGEALTFEERGEHQLLAQWGIPPNHFARLPRELQVAELSHFTRKQPKTLTLRATDTGGHPAVRSVMSSRYSPFDNADVLRAIEPHLDRFELQRSHVGRDEMVLALTLREEYDVSLRKLGDTVKAGLTLRNSEVGTMSLGVELSTWRLACLNGMVVPTEGISITQRHIWIDRKGFETELLATIENAGVHGRSMVERLSAAQSLRLPNLDPDDGKLQAAVARTLRREGIWTQTFREEAERVLGSEEEASLFGLIQFLTGDFAKRGAEDVRLTRERVAGRLLSLGA